MVLVLLVTGEGQPKPRDKLRFLPSVKGLANAPGLWVNLGCSGELCPGPVSARRKLLSLKIHPVLTQLHTC